MQNHDAVILILWTCATVEEARTICEQLVEKRWVACANLIPSVESIYFWKDRVEKSHEVKVFLKALDPYFEQIKEYIRMHCSYDVPEISKILIDEGNPDYFEWMRQLSGDKKKSVP